MIIEVAPEARVSLGELGIISVKASDLERIKRLNVPDSGTNGSAGPNPLEEGSMLPVNSRNYIDIETQGRDKQEVKLEAPVFQGVTVSPQSAVEQNGDPKPSLKRSEPAYTRVNNSWRLNGRQI